MRTVFKSSGLMFVAVGEASNRVLYTSSGGALRSDRIFGRTLWRDIDTRYFARDACFISLILWPVQFVGTWKRRIADGAGPWIALCGRTKGLRDGDLCRSRPD